MSRSFIVIMLGLFVLAGLAFFFVLYEGSKLAPVPENSSTGASASTPGIPALPPPPSVTLTIQKGTKSNTLFVNWQNLPANTTALDIYRSKKGKNNWKLWQTIAITSDLLSGGRAAFDIGNSTFVTYSFYIQAVNKSGNSSTGGGGGNPTNPQGQTVLWTSSPTDAPVATSTPQVVLPPSNPTPTSTNNIAPTSTSPTPTSTKNPPNQTSTTSAPPPPSGTPYYTPALQISGYGNNPAGTFWVQHLDETIQIGWQNLPPPTTEAVVVRSLSQSGPWTTVFSQKNPDLAASSTYSIQIVDDTVGQAYYYDLNANAGSSTIVTYGPVYLPPVGH